MFAIQFDLSYSILLCFIYVWTTFLFDLDQNPTKIYLTKTQGSGSQKHRVSLVFFLSLSIYSLSCFSWYNG